MLFLTIAYPRSCASFLKRDIIRNSYINYHAYCKQPSLFITVQVRITLIPFTDLYEYYVLQRRF